jgi:hypothetical protein
VKLGQLITLSALVASSVAQADLGDAKKIVGPAMANLAVNPQIFFDKNGTVDVNGTTANIRTYLAFRRFPSTPTDCGVRMEISQQLNGSEYARAVVDGSRIWYYKYSSNTYNVFAYNHLAPIKQTEAILNTLTKTITGEDQFLPHLLLESLLTGGDSTTGTSRWLPWMPTAKVTVTGGDIRAVSTIPNYRDITYKTVNISGSDYLEQIIGRTERNQAGRYTINDWIMSIATTIPAGVSFSFTPPTGSRAIAGTVAQGG